VSIADTAAVVTDSTLVVLRQIESHLDWIAYWHTALLVGLVFVVFGVGGEIGKTLDKMSRN